MEILESAPILRWDPFSDAVLSDPYPFYEALREAGPIAFIEQYDYYAVGRYSSVQAVLTDYARFTAEGGVGLSDIRKAGAWRPPDAIASYDPPAHTALRKGLQRALSPVTVRGWSEGISGMAAQVVDEILDKKEVNGVTEIAERFVQQAFPAMAGLDVDMDRVTLIGELNFNTLGPNNDRLKESRARAEPILDWYATQLKRESVIPGGFADELFRAEDDGLLPPGGGERMLTTFFRAGLDTTIAGIGFAINQLARSPEQFDMLRDDSSLASNAFEEALRHESPAIMLFRTTTSGPVELDGTRLEPDTKVGFYLGAANRDPRRWDDPDRFDIRRKVLGEHLAFGAGVHVCIGQMIARAEGKAILSAIAKRVARIELIGDTRYNLINTLRTLDQLPLRIIAA